MDEETYEVLQFQYPVDDDRTALEADMILGENGKSIFIKSCIALGIGAVALAIELLFYSSLWLLLLGLAGIALSVIIAKRGAWTKHLLEIDAYESFISFTYYNAGSDELVYLTLDYSDIKGCLIDTDNYTAARLIYTLSSENSSQRKVKLSTTELIEEGQQGQIIIRLNSNTPEQAFFLYTAHKLFRTNYKQRKIVKRFGTEEEFYKKIYGNIVFQDTIEGDNNDRNEDTAE